MITKKDLPVVATEDMLRITIAGKSIDVYCKSTEEGYDLLKALAMGAGECDNVNDYGFAIVRTKEKP